MTTPKFFSESFDATATSIMDLSQRVGNAPHVFVGVTFRDSGGAAVTPSGGTYTIEIRPVGMENYQPIRGATDIIATEAPEPLDFAINSQSLRYTPTGITDAHKIQISVTGNFS